MHHSRPVNKNVSKGAVKKPVIRAKPGAEPISFCHKFRPIDTNGW